MKQFVEEQFPICRVDCLEYGSEVIACTEEFEKRREMSARLSDVCFRKSCTEYCISNTPRYARSWACFWMQIGILKDRFGISRKV